jgi:hypothetical protein
MVPAVEGWFTTEAEPALLGTRCGDCGTYFFPKETTFCRNPECRGSTLEEVRLSSRGKVWSYTTNHYAPPPPYVAPDPFEPYTVAAVELAEEKLIVLGQLAGDPAELRVGSDVVLVLDTLFEDDDHTYVVWKWEQEGRPRAGQGPRVVEEAGLGPRREREQ